MRRRSLLGAVVAGALGATAGCDDDDPPPPNRLVIAAGKPGEVYTTLGGVLAAAARKRWKIPVEVLETSGSVDNVRRLMSGAADIAFTTVDVAATAQAGDKPFGSARPIAALASLYDDYLHIVVREDAGITRISGLADKRVSTGPVDSAIDILARRVLTAAALTDTRLPALAKAPQPVLTHDEPATAADMLAGNAIDAFFTIGGLPDDTVKRLADRVPVRLLPVGDDVGTLQERFGEYFVTRSIPANTYGVNAEVVTLGVRTILVVRRDVPDSTAYHLVRLLFENREPLRRAHPEAQRLDERLAPATFPIDLHSGVNDYYRQVKPHA